MIAAGVVTAGAGARGAAGATLTGFTDASHDLLWAPWHEVGLKFQSAIILGTASVLKLHPNAEYW
jgi:hypothetical protein